MNQRCYPFNEHKKQDRKMNMHSIIFLAVLAVVFLILIAAGKMESSGANADLVPANYGTSMFDVNHHARAILDTIIKINAVTGHKSIVN
jgi:hypothetical protein